MNHDEQDELSARLRAAGEHDEEDFDPEEGRRRLSEGLHRLRNDPAEQRRVDEIAQEVEDERTSYDFALEALQQQDFRTAERYLRTAAQNGNDEAAHLVSMVLRRRSIE